MINIDVYSNRDSKGYKINRISEYDIDTSLDIAADHFSIVIENPVDKNTRGYSSGVFNDNDNVLVKEENVTILNGLTDDVTELWGESGSRIEIVGRDMSMLLLENDAIPKTYYKLKLSSFIKTIAAPYKYFKVRVNPKFDKILDKIVVDTGQTEWDCLMEEAKKCGLWLWCEPDLTIVADKLGYNQDYSYVFSNSELGAIPMKSFSKKKRGADVKNEVWVRGHGKKAFTSKYKDSKLTGLGYRRRMIIEDGDAKTSSKAQNIAKDKVNETKRGSFEIEITINGRHFIEANKTAKIVDKVTDTNSVFFIIGVRRVKNNSVGHENIVRLRPLWEGL